MGDPSRHDVTRLLVDGRAVCHPTAGERGIGRYTIGLLGGLQNIAAPVVALYESDAEAARLRAAVPDLALQQLNPGTIRQHTEPGVWFVATQLMLHPIPLDPVPRIVTDSGLPVAAVTYDVIPERYPEQYQVRPVARAQVQLRGMLTRTLDALLAISDFAAETSAQELRFPRDRIATIGAGREPRFKPGAGYAPTGGARANVISVVGGSDSRKNVQRLLHAWGLLPTPTRRTHQLLIVGSADRSLLQQWRHWAAESGVLSDVTFTGSVGDDELVALLQQAKLAVVPSTEEGFGLPVLEAAACGCPVLMSNVSALPEILAEPAAQFDPFDAESIASAIRRALTDVKHRADLVAASERAAKRWTWDNVAHAVVDALQGLGPRSERTLRVVPQRIALVGRFDNSDIGLANAEFAHSLSRHPLPPEITLLVENGTDATPTFANPLRFPARALGRYLQRSQFDDIITLPVPS